MKTMTSRRATAILSGVLILGLGGGALAAQDKYKVKVPNGLSFGEFKGYEAWQAVAVSVVPEGQKLIAANPAMIAAYRSGLPAAGRKFPDGSRAVKIEWSAKPNTVSPYQVAVPDQLLNVSFMVKDSKRFPKTAGWAYASFAYDPKTKTFTPKVTGTDCGHACHTTVAAQDYVYTAYPVR